VVLFGVLLVLVGECWGVWYLLGVFIGVCVDSDIYCEELFGFVVMVFRVSDEDDVVCIVNDMLYGLGLYVFIMDVD